MIELHHNQLVFRFPQVHPEAELRVDFQRTLRIPDDDQEYPLPPGLGRFPLDHVDDFEAMPGRWKSRGGVIMPMWQAEAAWVNFDSHYPMAVKVAAGKINAVTGQAWSNELCNAPQDYVVTPGQRWLDGFCVDEGLIRQFVAMPLGEGVTVEEQLNGEAEHGGLQIIVYPMRASVYDEIKRKEMIERQKKALEMRVEESAKFCRGLDYGMAPGGLMQQEIYDDHHGIDAWEHGSFSRCFVHLTNAEQYHGITGKLPADKPPKPKDYAEAGLPWFNYYQSDLKALGGSSILARLDSLASVFRKKADQLPDNEPVVVGQTIELGDPATPIRDDW